jgi:menaquinone-specific isochorismate synthase
MLVRREKGLVTSRVLAGTIRRTGDDAHDLALAARLARSARTSRSTSTRSARSRRRSRRTALDERARVARSCCTWRTSCTWPPTSTGVLADGSTALELAAALHPSAAVCGTPTASARRSSTSSRAWTADRYAGPVGWMDAQGDGEWGIALRCARLDPATAPGRLFAGCGIVAGSTRGRARRVRRQARPDARRPQLER